MNPINQDVLLLINNQYVPATHNATFGCLNPVSGNLVTRASAASVDDAISAVEAASAAFEAWAAMGPTHRRLLLLKCADALEAKSAYFLDAMTAETGSTVPWAEFNVHLAANILREAAAITTQVGGEVIPSDVPGNLAMGVRVPAGVVLGIAPWNAPIILAVRAIATPLACGNTVVLKGSELCPRTHSLICETLIEAGLPAGVLNFISHAPEDAPAVVEAMIAHKSVRRVNFTGSTRVGRLIGISCAKHLKPAVLELGGKAPFIVLDDADIDSAVKAAAFGAFMNSGQICMSTERIIVHEKVADEFVGKLADRIRNYSVGNPLDGSPVVLGPVISRETVDRCNRLIENALALGAKILVGSTAKDTLMPATVLDHVTTQMKIFREESFGPVKSVIRVKSIDEAIAVANDSEYGLSSAVFGRDIARAWQVAKRLDTGICHVNGATLHDEPHMPFGGVKASGYGHFGGQAGVAAFTELRWITMQMSERTYPV